MINMKKLLTLISLITVTLMLLCSCGGSVDTSTDEASDTEAESSTGSTNSGSTDSGSRDSDTTDSGTGDSDAPTGDSDTTDSGTGEAPPSGDGSGDLVDDPNVDDWWTDNKQ